MISYFKSLSKFQISFQIIISKSLTGVWVAIDDAMIDNGCLWVLPGSHGDGFIYPTTKHGDPQHFDATPRAVIEHFGKYEYDQMSGGIPVEVKSGDAVFFNGYTLHRSLLNVSNRSRLSFANHYMSAKSMLPWNYDNRLDGYVRDARDIVMVSQPPETLVLSATFSKIK